MSRRFESKSKPVPYTRSRVSERELVRQLRFTADALRNAAEDRIVDGGRAMALEHRCRAYAARISSYWYWDPIRRRHTLPLAYRLVETSLDFLQEAIDDQAARFDADTSLDSRIEALAAFLNLPIPAADDI